MENEDKVLDETGGRNVKIFCDDECKHLLVECDCLIDAKKEAKEVQSSGGGFDDDQFDNAKKRLEDDKVLKDSFKIKVAIVCPTKAESEAAARQLEQDNPDKLTGRTQPH